jgi:branched-chain amino acid transport system permease protein
MIDIIQVIVSGFMLGGIYSIAALGLTVCFGVLNVLNVAHGEFLMLGAFSGYLAFKLFGMNPFLSIIPVLGLFTVIGYFFERVFIEPISNRTFHEMLIASTLVTFGLALAIEDIVAFIWAGAEAGISYEMPNFSLGGVHISSLRLLSFIAIILLTVLFQIFLKRTYIGKALRAITLNRRGAMVVGIDIKKISRVTFGIGISLAAMSGIIYATLYTFDPFIGLPLTVKVLAVIVLGGIGSFTGALAGGLLLGITECIVGQFFGLEWSPAVAFLLLILILIFRPEGIFGRSLAR